MSDSTRRGFLKVAGVGVAAAGAATVIPNAAANASTPKAESLTPPDGAEASLVAYVADVHSGTVALLIEGHEYTVTDRALVARLAHAVHAAKSA